MNGSPGFVRRSTGSARETDRSRSRLFPFPNYRAGQRELARQVYRSIRDEQDLFLEAPTGMGKTLATLFPAIKALPRLADGKIFYLTAKTPGRLAAQDALEQLRQAGVHVRSLEITAKAKICFAEEASGCDAANCPFTKGYYDRYKPAMRELLCRQRLDREAIETCARKHTVCPYELSLDVSAWVDVVIGDYNYVFDPSVRLQRYFGEGKPSMWCWSMKPTTWSIAAAICIRPRWHWRIFPFPALSPAARVRAKRAPHWPTRAERWKPCFARRRQLPFPPGRITTSVRFERIAPGIDRGAGRRRARHGSISD